ncbi:Feruloyl esterase [Lithohypha guttulata]|uniref:Feruloyl esterase n=1 Tax=Lithohypha guttulata TaxID=1690604 RepID=UPI002DE0A243|nr:Tannase [Lithohypha guttulata]
MLLLCCLLTLAGVSYAQSFAEQCQSFQPSIPNVQVNVLEFVPKGTNLSLPYNDASCNQNWQSIYGTDFCRVAMDVRTSNTSNIILEAWLPTNWNGRFLSTGNGGLAGCIQYADIAYANMYNFAVVGANNGHNGTSGRPFLNSPGVVEDFAYRSIHTGVVVGKQLTEQFYSSPINHSYYLGCSTGGRQGMKSAQMFHEDFDGIVAGAPAFDFNHLTDWSGWLSLIAGTDNTSASFITRNLWTIINNEVIRQCDSIDGAVDGILEDPDLCQPKLETLLCSPDATNTSACLNSGQYDRAVKLFEPLYNASGTLIYPRLQPGGHPGAYPLIFGGQIFQYTVDWFRYAVYNDPSWDPTTLDQADFTYLDKLDPYNISTWNGDLSPFASRGGKILTYHGLQDPIITSENSGRYYSHLSSTMRLPPNVIDEFYRYFRISGLSHCSGGPGAFDVGQRYLGRPADVSTPTNNVLQAIVSWVEDGQAPEYIEGIRWVNNNASQGVAFKRRHCRYPRRNVYTGTGNGTDENGWQCVF